MEQEIRSALEKALAKFGIEGVDFVVEHPADFEHGDYASNVALIAGKKTGENPKELAEKLTSELTLEFCEKVEVAGPGFINFYLSRDYFKEVTADVIPSEDTFGRNNQLKGQKVMVEYTDPNPFKEFHIGHLMSNTIGESISRLIEYSGAEVKRANYQGDVGLHVAKAIWGKKQKPELSWGDAYAHGAQNYDAKKEEIDGLNKIIYERSDKDVNNLYDEGRKETLEGFENIYKKLGTKFDEYFFESEVSEPGKKIVEEKKGDVFSESEGAVVFSEERSGLHTRVFLNSQGIPTYEAKELALAKLKHDRYVYDVSIVITANEIDQYFQVVLKAMESVYSDLASKTKHLSHGMLRLPSGKMSSRSGDVVTVMSLIDEVKERVLARMEDKDEKIAEQVAIGALKYEILKQAPGKDIVFDKEKALSLEGDSGPYLQYTAVRAKSVLDKAKSENLEPSTSSPTPDVFPVERLIYRFPEVAAHASANYAPQHVLHYLTELASSFNNFYASEKIVDKSDEYSPYKLALTAATALVLTNGLFVLGIHVPERM